MHNLHIALSNTNRLARLRVHGLVGMSNCVIMDRTGIAIAAIILLSSASNGWSQTAPYPVKLVRIVNPALPAVATIEEADLAGFHDSTFNGLMAPAGTPREPN